MVCVVKTGMSSINRENWKEMLKRRCCRREEVKGAKITNLLWKYSATQANCTHCQDAGNCMRVRSREYSYEYTLLSGYRVVSPR